MPTIRIPVGNREAGPSGASVDLTIEPGEIIAVLGANGAGKSAFLHDVYKLVVAGRDNRRLAEWLPAHRHITLSSDNYMITSTNASEVIERQSIAERQDDARFRPKRGESLLQALLQRIVDLENQKNREFREASRENYAEAEKIDKATGSFVDEINSVFARGALNISFSVVEGALAPTKGGTSYKLPALSDGERAALLLTGAVLSAESGQILFIDEPEKHLNPAISQPLMRALAAHAEDVGIVFSTHDVDLIESIRPSRIVILKDSVPLKWYDIEIVPPDEIENIEHAKSTILGGRKRTLLIEGTKGSLDAALYSIMYEGWNVQPVGSHSDVTEGVRSLRRNGRWHWIEAAGLIDRDGRADAEVATLEADRVFPIFGASIESLLLDSAVMLPVAELKHSTEGGASAQDRIVAAQAAAVAEIADKRRELSAHIANWRFARALLANKPSVAQIRDGHAQPVNLDPAQFLQAAAAELDSLLARAASLDELGIRIPLKSSGAKAVVARALGFANFDGYVSLILHNLSKNTETGALIRAAIARRLPAL